MRRYAENTSVPTDRSKAEIERTLTRYGATEFVSGWNQGEAMLAFTMSDRTVRFILPMPNRRDFARTPTGKERTSEAKIDSAWEQAQRQKWRALALVVKAKLEAVEAEITTFEEEFLAHIVLPNNKTVGQWMIPQLTNMRESKKMPPLLPAQVG